MSPRTTVHAIERARADSLALRHPVAHEADDVRVAREQALDEPAAEQARRAGDEHRAVEPVGVAHQTLQGALPLCHSPSSSSTSRIVSMGCQKPSCW